MLEGGLARNADQGLADELENLATEPTTCSCRQMLSDSDWKGYLAGCAIAFSIFHPAILWSATSTVPPRSGSCALSMRFPISSMRNLVDETAAIQILPLPEPDEVPMDERTAEFISHLEHAKSADAVVSHTRSKSWRIPAPTEISSWRWPNVH